jgi:PAS domain S-box-containing protein
VAWLVFGSVLGWYHPLYPTESLPRQFAFVAIILLVTAVAIQVLSNTLRVNAFLLQQELLKGRRVESALRDAEELYRNIVEKTSVITYRDSADKGSITLYMSPQIEEVLGYSPAEWMSIPRFWATVIHPDDLGSVTAGIDSLLQGHERNISEYRVKAKDGRWVWFQDEAVLIKNEQGEASYIHGVLLNITEKKTAESKVKQREAVLGAVAEAAQHLLRAASWRNEIDEILKLLGRATGASHVYIFENHVRPSDGILLSSMKYEWAAEGMTSELENPNYQDSYLRPAVPGMEDWYLNLSAGKAF